MTDRLCNIAAVAVFLNMLGSYDAFGQDVSFREDFTGQYLKPELVVKSEDRDRWTLLDNDYLYIIPKNIELDEVNIFEFDGELSSDYRVSLKISSPPWHKHIFIYLSIKSDDDNWMQISYSMYPSGGIWIEFMKNLKGEISAYERKDNNLKETTELYLSIEKHGIEYTASYSVDGDAWQNLGTHAFLDFDGMPVFSARNQEDAPEGPVKVDYFEIVPLKQD